MVQVVVNGAAVATRCTTLAELVIEQGFGEARVATALNGSFVPARERAATRLETGDRVEILAARQGG